MKNDRKILAQSIIKTMTYFDLFHYPLRSEEIFYFLSTNHVDERDVRSELTTLSQSGLIFNHEDFFLLENISSLVLRRKKGNLTAEKYLDIARKKATVIMRCPFVRGVLVSGSLSKNYADENSDIDFFIITQPQKLWISRFLLMVYKKVFLLNSHKYFCINYFVDFNHLQIEEKNIFTATELSTLIPLQGKEYCEELVRSNQWVKEFLPNYMPRSTKEVPASTTNKIKVTAEAIIGLLSFKWMDFLLMKLFFIRWTYKASHNQADFKIAFKTNRHVSKSHPKHYQKKVLQLYEERLSEMSAKFPSIFSNQNSKTA